MKTRRLHRIDLARIAPLPREERRPHLEAIGDFPPPFTYRPLNACSHDIFNIEGELLGSAAPTPWPQIEGQINGKAKSDRERKANIAVARGLHEFALSTGLHGRELDLPPIALGVGYPVSYWLPLILAYQDRPMILFIEPRQASGLTELGRRFVFSVMNERFRVADPDYSSVRFGIVQFKAKSGDRRPAILHVDDEVQPFSFDELDRMVRETYELWEMVCSERVPGKRATGTGGGLI